MTGTQREAFNLKRKNTDKETHSYKNTIDATVIKNWGDLVLHRRELLLAEI